jgi:putative glutamine amidotransferase
MSESAINLTPFVLLPACHREFEGRIFHAVPEDYAAAVRLAGCQPLLVPGVWDGELESLLELAAGILLPGSPNNVEPSHFGEEVLDPTLPLDPRRDALTLPLIRRALERGIPVLGICRGFQEMNVALGGSLHQAIDRVPGFNDHQATVNEAREVRYGPAHEIELTPGGMLVGLLGADQVMVNSVHGQGINRLAAGLRVEARAPDGVIEAITLPTAPGFNLGVQWHPEWQAAGNPVSMAIFQAFGAACRAFARRGLRDQTS